MSFSTQVLLFCFVCVALSHAYLRDVTPGGYGIRRGEYGKISPVYSHSGPPTLKDRHATRGVEINRGEGGSGDMVWVRLVGVR